MRVLLHRFSLSWRRYAQSIFPPPLLSSPLSINASSSPQPCTGEASQLLQKLREIGIDDGIVKHLENQSDSSVVGSSWQKIHLLMAEGVSVHQLNHFLRKCGLRVDDYFVGRPLDRLIAVLTFFKSVHVEKQDLGRIFINRPGILRRQVESLESKFTILQNLGIERKDMAKIYVKYPRVFDLSDDTWEQRLHFWKKLGVSNESLRRMMQVQPQKLTLSCEKHIQPFITYFESHGISKDVVALTLIRYRVGPGLSMEDLSLRMEFLQNVGFKTDSERIMRVYVQLASCNLQLLQSRLDWLTIRGFSADEVRRLVRICPTILTKRIQTTEKTLDYLLNVLKLDLKKILCFPHCLIFSLEKRIKPRFTLLAERGVNKFTALSSMLHCSDCTFEEKYIDKMY